jgi:hypothetical protein
MSSVLDQNGQRDSLGGNACRIKHIHTYFEGANSQKFNFRIVNPWKPIYAGVFYVDCCV